MDFWCVLQNGPLSISPACHRIKESSIVEKRREEEHEEKKNGQDHGKVYLFEYSFHCVFLAFTNAYVSSYTAIFNKVNDAQTERKNAYSTGGVPFMLAKICTLRL